MKNRQVYLKDPDELRLLNNGVATVSDERTAKERQTLRYELETFVCEGGFEKGLDQILGSFLSSLSATEQPGVWVSGFYGSGKSHLVKVLRALWVDETFPEDNATARGITSVPQEISDHLHELSNQAKKVGGLHAASGTLGSGVGDRVRLALLAVVFRSAGLPPAYPQARFVMWLRREGYLEAVRKKVEDSGRDWHEELNDMLVSTSIPKALLAVDPDFTEDDKEARSHLLAQFPPVEDVTTDEMIDAIKEAIEKEDGQFPLTLIVLDEMQQYIGEDPDRAFQVQEVVEACSKKFEGRLLFVATGQSAIAGTPLLMKLKGRFSIPVVLSDADVETVVRQIVLAKKANAKQDIKAVLDDNIGEISKHLVGSRIGYQHEDQATLVADYPLLPVRRRFWERCLRAVDPSGTKAQLRNQLRVVHEATRQTADQDLGCIVAGDFIYDQIAPDMLNTGELPREAYEKIQALKATDSDLKPRIAALSFLIGKLPREGASDLGVRATEQSFADLLVTDLRAGSGSIHKRLPDVLQSLVDTGLLMPVGDEYLIQTQEGGAWLAEFMAQKTQIAADGHRVTNERDQLFREEWRSRVGGIKHLHGESREPRKPELCFGAEPPADADHRVYVWARDGWDADESAVKSEALQAGTRSPTLFAFLPHKLADELKSTIIEWRAAEATLNARGIPNTPEGQEARSAMLTRQQKAQRRLRDAIDKVFADVQLYGGGGQAIDGVDVVSKVEHGLEASLARLYPKFDVADYANWSKVIDRAKGGSANPLDVIGHTGNVNDHEVCAEIVKFVGSGKKGSKIREQFSGSPYGWPRDAIDGGIFALACAGHLEIQLNRQNVDVGGLTQGQVTKHTYRVEIQVPAVDDRIRVRKILQELAIPHTTGDEQSAAVHIVPQVLALADAAGGEPPRPARSDTKEVEDLQSLHGNELLIELSQRQEMLLDAIATWRDQANAVAARIGTWEKLQRLLRHVGDLRTEESDSFHKEAQTISDQRQLLDNPEPVKSLYERVVQSLREALVRVTEKHAHVLEERKRSLAEDPAWGQLSPEQQKTLLKTHGLDVAPTIETATADDVSSTLDATPLGTWGDRTGALSSRFAEMRLSAAQLLEPEARPLSLPHGTLRNADEARQWLGDVTRAVETAIKDGPIVV